MFYYHQSIDYNLLSYHKVMAKKRMPIYGIIDILRSILAYNLDKYQYFSMRPSVFDK